MIKPLNKITIVGGGSAGWMTAALLIKEFPNKEIILIESPDVPINGVGESTLSLIKKFVQYLGIDETDFISFTDATFKLSIKFTDFYEKDSGSFHYPFGDPFLDGTVKGIEDWFYKKALYSETPVEDFVRCYYPSAALFENNKFSLNEHGKFHNWNPRWSAAYHFDAVKFGQWLKERYCLPRGVKHLSAHVKDIPVNEKGINHLVLDDNTVVESDLFVDCTGFRSLLLGIALNEPFTSYADMLPNNRAWATRVPYIDKEKEIEPYTNCTAIGNGWVWNIPLWSRLGTGYVYSDKFVDPEYAKEEFKQYLMSNKVVCPKTREQVESLEFKDIPMRVGIHERTWVKNCVAIGLSAGFIEPLESNGLFSVHEFLFKLIKTLSRPAITQWDIDVYNAAVLNIFRNFSEFVALHYALSIRNDTDYWKANSNRVYSPGLPFLEPQVFQGFYDLQYRKMISFKVPNKDGITFISTGMKYPILDSVTIKSDQLRDNADYQKIFANSFESFEKKKSIWNEAAKLEPSLYQWLKTNIYKDQ